MELKDMVGFVTGAAAGIGLAISQEFLKAGIKGLLMSDINTQESEKQLEVLRKEFGKERVSFIELDVTDSEKFEVAFQTAISTFGHLDIVVNNAGIPYETCVEKIVAINLTAVIIGNKLALKYLGKDQKGAGGVILNISSMAALEVFYPITVYAATKSGVAGLTRALGHPSHLEKTSVKVIGICPGKTMTNFFKDEIFNKRPGMEYILNYDICQEPDVMGKAAVYLVNNADSGSLWIVNQSNLYKADIPAWETYSTFIKNLKSFEN